MLNSKNQKYLHISQHWSGKKGVKNSAGEFVYVNPVTDEGKRQLSSLKDLQTLIDFWGWGDSGVYYSFSDKGSASWGQEVYEISGEALKFVGADYDSSD